MGRGQLVFKGEKKKKVKKADKHKHKHKSKLKRSTSPENVPQSITSPSSATLQSSTAAKPSTKASIDGSHQQPVIKTGTGEITASGSVVTGHGTRFQRELSAGDAILVKLPHQKEEMMRVVTMCLSDTSINLSSAFGENLSQPVSFSYINKPRNAVKEARDHAQQQAQAEKELEQHAFGTYTGGQGEELVYRQRTTHGSYQIKRVKLDKAPGTLSRGDMLDMRAKKSSDKYC